MAIEFAPWGALSQIKQATPPPTTLECTKVLGQLLAGLEYIHGLNPPILHGDLKPANALLMYRRRECSKQDDPMDLIHVKIGDFGLAQDKENPYFTGGTPNTVAPELAQRWLLCSRRLRSLRPTPSFTMAVTKKADVYSCAVTIVDISIGLGPFNEDNFERVWQTYTHVQKSADCGERPVDERHLLRLLLTKMMPFCASKRGSSWECRWHAQYLVLSLTTAGEYDGDVSNSDSEGASTQDRRKRPTHVASRRLLRRRRRRPVPIKRRPQLMKKKKGSRDDPMDDAVQHPERTSAKVAAIDARAGTKRPRPDNFSDAEDEGERKPKRVKKMSARVKEMVDRKLMRRGK